ncbi:hypothetical protein MMPV_008028 [Pyropia vietnamensis]
MLSLSPRDGRRLRVALACLLTGGTGGRSSSTCGVLGGGDGSRRAGGGSSMKGRPRGWSDASRRVVAVVVAAATTIAAAVWLLTAASDGDRRGLDSHRLAARAQQRVPAGVGLVGDTHPPPFHSRQRRHRLRRPVRLRPVPPRRSPPTALQERVVAATRSAWAAYVAGAWGADELLPVTSTARDYWHLGLTILDSADTLYLLGLKDEYAAAREWVAGPALADFVLDANVSVFETTIRALGGLLGAYTVSGDEMWLERAAQLGDRLLPAFDTPGVPHSNLNLASGLQTHGTHPAEALSLGLEFRTLTYLTGDIRYAAAVRRLTAAVAGGWPDDGLLGNELDVETATFGGDLYTAGNRVDSAYEYLAKQCLLLGGGGAGCVSAIRDEGRDKGKSDNLLQTAMAVRQNRYVTDKPMGAAREKERMVTGIAASVKGGGGDAHTPPHEPFTAALVRSEAAYFGRLFLRSAEAINARLVTTSPGGRVLLGEIRRYSGSFTHAGMDHLACYWPGVLALASWSGLEDPTLRPSPLPAAVATATDSEVDVDDDREDAADGNLRSGTLRAVAAAHRLRTARRQRRWGWASLAGALTDTCAAMSSSTRTGLAPEGVLLDIDRDSGRERLLPRPGGAYNVLRPEVVEALFLLHRTSTNTTTTTSSGGGGFGDGDSRAATAAAAVASGTQILDAFDAVSRLPATGAYASVVDVMADPAAVAGSPNSVRHFSAMESFFLAETLKYLYLLFEAPPDGAADADAVLLPLDRYVFNTEAHPLPVFDMDTWGEENGQG